MRFLVLMVAQAVLSLQLFAIDEGDMFPKVNIAKNEKQSLSSNDLMGKVTVVNFWATWCEACKVELKEMQIDFAELFKQKDFQFAFVSLDKDPNNASTWVKENLQDSEAFLKYLYQDPESTTADLLNVDAFPMTLVIGRDGKVVKIQRGFKAGEDSTKKIAQVVETLLKS